ncbi:hypothetical protein [Streptomyces sp. NRRL S-337]|uniref:hypothetical protein n=1 Tax=Streptomyces sp. NRRL S-337 TaxID=1463900 RepID=UPI0004CB0049|nr:hypothetical protein [Streptomyces sp. NRRL S-337]
MYPTEKPRLLPWSSPDGKPCYLAGDGNGYVSRLADNVEAAQLSSAAELIEEARPLLAGRTWTPEEVHLLACVLTASLADVHRVAESRGARMPAPDDDEPDSDAAPGGGDGGKSRLPADAFD